MWGCLGPMGTYGITFLGDDSFAPGVDFALVAMADGGWLFYRESAVCPRVLSESWAAYRALLAEQDPDGDDPEREPESHEPGTLEHRARALYWDEALSEDVLLRVV